MCSSSSSEGFHQRRGGMCALRNVLMPRLMLSNSCVPSSEAAMLLDVGTAGTPAVHTRALEQHQTSAARDAAKSSSRKPPRTSTTRSTSTDRRRKLPIRWPPKLPKLSARCVTYRPTSRTKPGASEEQAAREGKTVPPVSSPTPTSPGRSLKGRSCEASPTKRHQLYSTDFWSPLCQYNSSSPATPLYRPQRHRQPLVSGCVSRSNAERFRMGYPGQAPCCHRHRRRQTSDSDERYPGVLLHAPNPWAFYGRRPQPQCRRP